MLWLVFGLMLLAAVLVVAWPLYREERRLSARSALTLLGVLALSAGLYSEIGEPDAETTVAADTDVDEMVERLASRLETEKDDVDGWKMLGRSYSQLKRYPAAIEAYENAAELEAYSNGQTLVDFGEAVMLNDGSSIEGRAGELFENALAVAPGNPKALFYGGISAINRGNRELAAERWELLLASAPPPEIEGILRQRIAEWRGEANPLQATQAASNTPPSLTVNVRLDEAAMQSVDPAATLFVIARDPAQPSPPIAAIRRLASELPFAVSMSDSDSMIPGRNLSGFSRLEIIVRASGSGQPIAQPGDWFGSLVIDTATTRSLDIVIDRQVP